MKLTTLFLTLTLSLAAQASDDEDSGASLPPPEKSELVAYGLAIAGTFPIFFIGAQLAENRREATGIAIMASSILFGPSLGQYYMGSLKQGTAGILFRSLGGLIFLNALLSVSHGNVSNDELVLGEIVSSAGLLYSFIDTHYAVKRANARAREGKAASSTRFDLFPTLSRTTEGGLGAGMMVRGGILDDYLFAVRSV